MVATNPTRTRPYTDLMPFVTTVQLQLAMADGHVQLMDVDTGLIVYITVVDPHLDAAQRRAMQWARRHGLDVLWQ